MLSAYGENHLFLAKNHNYFFAESQGLIARLKMLRIFAVIETFLGRGSTLEPLFFNG